MIEREEDVIVVFYDDGCGVFDQMSFGDREKAESALERNGFSKFRDDEQAQEMLGLPNDEFTEKTHPNGRIYSSGRFWKKR